MAGKKLDWLDWVTAVMVVALIIGGTVASTLALENQHPVKTTTPTTGTVILVNGGAETVRCPNGLTNANLGQSPLVVHCIGSTTTTTVAPTTTVPSTTTTAPTTTTTLPPSEPVSPTPAAEFTSSDLFNQVVQTSSGLAAGWTVNPNSAAIVTNLVNSVTNSGYDDISFDAYYPIVYVNPNTPLVPISWDQGQPHCNDFTGDQLTPNGQGATGTEVPFIIADAYLIPTTSDHPLIVFEPATGREWELWVAAYSSTTGLSACWGGELSVSSSNGFFQGDYGLSATGNSYLGTIVTEQDIASGSINHAIALQVFGENCTSWVYPAPRGDCGSNGTNMPAEGEFFIWPSSINCAAYDATQLENMICVAGQVHGFFVADQAGDVQVMGEDPGDGQAQGEPWLPPSWVDNSAGQCCVQKNGTDPISLAEDSTAGQPSTQEQAYSVINKLPWSQLEVVTPPPGY